MAGEIIVVDGTTVTAITTTATLATGAYTATGNSTITALSQGSAPYAQARAVFTGAFAVAPSADKFLRIYRRDLNVDGTADAPVTGSAYPEILVGILRVAQTTSSQTLVIPKLDCTVECEFYMRNDSGQTLNSGATLKVTPWTEKQAA